MAIHTSINYLKLTQWFNDNRMRLNKDKPTINEIRKIVLDETSLSFSAKVIREFKKELGIVYPEEQTTQLEERVEKLESIVSMLIELLPPEKQTYFDFENPDNN